MLNCKVGSSTLLLHVFAFQEGIMAGITCICFSGRNHGWNYLHLLFRKESWLESLAFAFQEGIMAGITCIYLYSINFCTVLKKCFSYLFQLLMMPQIQVVG